MKWEKRKSFQFSKFLTQHSCQIYWCTCSDAVTGQQRLKLGWFFSSGLKFFKILDSIFLSNILVHLFRCCNWPTEIKAGVIFLQWFTFLANNFRPFRSHKAYLCYFLYFTKKEPLKIYDKCFFISTKIPFFLSTYSIFLNFCLSCITF